jgi:hypothetical protein
VKPPLADTSVRRTISIEYHLYIQEISPLYSGQHFSVPRVALIERFTVPSPSQGCGVDFFVFESWQTAEDVMVLPCDFTAVCHDSKTKKYM